MTYSNTTTARAIDFMRQAVDLLKNPPMCADRPDRVFAIGFAERFMPLLEGMDATTAEAVLASTEWKTWVERAEALDTYAHLGVRMASQLRFKAWTPAVLYKPLMVSPQPSNKRAGSIIGFIGRQMCFFDDREAMPRVGEPVEVMISRALYGWRTIEPGQRGNSTSEPIQTRDWTKIVALVLRVVDPSKHVLSLTNGFECSGSMCSTTATGKLEGNPRDTAFHTPGRTDVFVADNVNADYGMPKIPRRPMWIWVNRNDTRRAEGLTRVDDATYASYVRR